MRFRIGCEIQFPKLTRLARFRMVTKLILLSSQGLRDFAQVTKFTFPQFARLVRFCKVVKYIFLSLALCPATGAPFAFRMVCKNFT